MKDDSPFTIGRFEYERSHLYYLPDNVFEVLEREKPVYVIGSRGTGKTTLLKALNWMERLENDSLKTALKHEPFQKPYIGVYIQMPAYHMTRFDKWLRNEEEDMSGPIFGMYIDLIGIELLSKALAELTIKGIFRSLPSDEHNLTKSLLNLNPRIMEFCSIERPCTLIGFRDVISKIRRKLERLAQLRISPRDIDEIYTCWQVGEFVRLVAEQMADYCNKFGQHINDKWHFKICMDESECLSPLQQRIVNTAVRLSQGIVIYVVSYVRMVDDISGTLITNFTLQKADRDIINLDVMKANEFKKLAEGVATVRIQSKANMGETVFNSRRILGNLNINAILQQIIDESESPKAKRILLKANHYVNTPFFKTSGWGSHNDSVIKKPLPIYQTYLIEKLNIKIPSPTEERWRRRSQESAKIRKRMVAAWLYLCNELKIKARYAFDQMVLEMSDNCIRDYLNQINEIYISSGLSLKDFVKTKSVSIKRQDKAIKQASKQKQESIQKVGVTAPDKIGRIFDGLARITASLQSNSSDLKGLSVSERGRFFIDTKSPDFLNYSKVVSLIKEAGEAGFLKIINRPGPNWYFQVHCSLAPAYGFSYRGAYYQTQLYLEELDQLINSEETEFEAVLKKIIRRLTKDSSQKLIFLGE